MGNREFTVLIAMIMSLSALGIDLMLPAFNAMRTSFHLPSDSTEVAGVVTAYFLGLSLPQLGYGLLSDRFGRRGVLFASFSVYALGALLSALAPSLEVLLLARFLWGAGAAGSRVVSVAIIRDLFEGEEMARAMSYIMAIFVLVPVVAPSLGSAILLVAPWRVLFVVCAGYVGVVGLWSLRLRESLPVSARVSLDLSSVWAGFRKFFTTRLTVGYLLAMTVMFGPFASYLASSERIISQIFGRPEQFPLIFGAAAMCLGGASLLNGRLVGRFGLSTVLYAALALYVAFSGALVAIALLGHGQPEFWLFFPCLAATLAAHIVVIPNLNTLAMGPVGDIAGLASALIGSVSMAGGAVLGTLLDHQIDAAVTPLTVGFLLAAVFATGTVVLTLRKPQTDAS